MKKSPFGLSWFLLSEQIRAESFKHRQYSEQSFFLGIRLGTETRALL